MNPDYWILDENTFFRLVDERTAKINADLKARFVMGMAKKGPVDLSSRDFGTEKWEEKIDYESYDIMDEERLKRAKELL